MLMMQLAALLAYFVKGLCGFANTLVFTSVVSFTGQMADITPVELMLGYPANLIFVWRERHAIRWRTCLPVIALVLLGDIPGVLLLKNVDAGSLRLCFGAVIILVALEMLLRDLRGAKGRSSGVLMVVIGLLSGVLCGLFGVGALLAAYMSRAAKDGASFRGNLCAVFAADGGFRLIAYTCMGLITWPVVWQALALVPAMLLALWAGMKCCGRLSESLARRVVQLMLIASGVSLIVTQLV